jgi:hypothetical protein
MDGIGFRGKNFTPHVLIRYSRAADWEYIAECAGVIKRAKAEMANLTDSSYNSLEFGESQRMAFIGYSHF